MATVDVKGLEIVNGELVAKVGEELKRLFPSTKAGNVQFTDKEGNVTDLATVVAAIVAELEKTATAENMEAAIETAVTAAVNKILGNAPEDGDSLEELFDLIKNNSEAMELLKSGQLDKVDKEDGKVLIASTLLAVLETISTEKITAWDKAQANVVEEVKVNGVAQVIDANKAVDLTVPEITVSATVPTDMKNGDLAFILHSDSE